MVSQIVCVSQHELSRRHRGGLDSEVYFVSGLEAENLPTGMGSGQSFLPGLKLRHCCYLHIFFLKICKRKGGLPLFARPLVLPDRDPILVTSFKTSKCILLYSHYEIVS